jgi:protein-S-isoprenylcysteine O-methyltransferase Ste14
MRFVQRLMLAALWLLCMGFVVAPMAAGSTVLASKDHPSSDAPWFIGVLVLLVLGGAMLLLLVKRGMSKRTKSGDFR